MYATGRASRQEALKRSHTGIRMVRKFSRALAPRGGPSPSPSGVVISAITGCSVGGARIDQAATESGLSRADSATSRLMLLRSAAASVRTSCTNA